jgi:uncharacterized membrane protein (UPF0127 family)
VNKRQNRFSFYLPLFLIVFLSFRDAGFAAPLAKDLKLPLPKKPLTISCPTKDLSFTIELAQASHEHKKGLMFRERLDEDGGMLFLYESPQPIAMWMKNTPLPLDMIFANEKGEILAIYEKATPYSLDVIGPVPETTHVLEINGGLVEKHGISRDCVLRF